MCKPQTLQANVYRENQLPLDHPRPDIERRRLLGEQAMISLVTLDAGCVVARHCHANEQMAFILEGSIRFTIGDPGHERVLLAQSGDFVLLPGGVLHGAVAEERCRVLDIFSPPSEETGIDSDS